MVVLLSTVAFWLAISIMNKTRDGYRRSVTASYDESSPTAHRAAVRHNSRCVKKVHIFGSFDIMKHIPELQEFTDSFIASQSSQHDTDIGCSSEGYDCDIALTIGHEMEMLKGKDAVVFGMVSTQFRGKEGNEQLQKLISHTPEPGQMWIYFSTEPPTRVLRWTSDLSIGRLKYHVLMTYDRDSDIELPFGYYKPFEKSNRNTTSTADREFNPSAQDPLHKPSGLISWVSSNCHSFWPREKLVEHLKQILPLDDYGRCGTKECLPPRSEECNKLFMQYKFYLATPNSECRDYITEKFWMQSLQHGTVPVVVGAKKDSYERVAPPHSFIHASDFKSFEDLAKYLQKLDKDDKEYGKYYDWRKQGEIVITFPTNRSVLCQALPHMAVKRGKEDLKHLSDSPWFKGCRVVLDANVMDMKLEKRLFGGFDNWSIWR